MILELREICPDCGAKMGQYHSSSCDVAHCPLCGTQALQDDCELAPLTIWTGIWPGELECMMYGLFSKFENGKWEKATADDPDANPDLNTLYTNKYKWSKELQLRIPA